MGPPLRQRLFLRRQPYRLLRLRPLHQRQNPGTGLDLLPPSSARADTASLQTNLAIGGAQSGGHNVFPALENFGAPSDFALPDIGRFQARGVTGSRTTSRRGWIGTNDIWPLAFPAGTLGPSSLARLWKCRSGAQPGCGGPDRSHHRQHPRGHFSLANEGFRNIVLLSPFDQGQTGAPNSNEQVPRHCRPPYSFALRDALCDLYILGVNTYFVNVLNLLQAA